MRHASMTFATLSLSLMLAAAAGCDEAEPGADAEGYNEGSGEAEADGCEELQAMRDCDDGEGTQFCHDAMGTSAEPFWGECVVDFECMPGETQSCGLGLGIDQGCRIGEDGVPQWDWEACNTPLVLDFDGDAIEMSTSSAAFDISGAGACLDTDWPAPSNPWLAVDLDRNGFIDGGHELFGSGTVLGAGKHAQNGFVALEPFDSNKDGRVDASDARFEELLVWRDGDGDKRSLPSELTTLSEEGVQRIDLDYDVRETCDARGNCGRERASFVFAEAGRVRTGEVVDVYLACQ